MKKLIFIILILLLIDNNIKLFSQQGLYVIKNIYNNYPNVSTFYYLFDNNGNPIRNLTSDDFAIRDNGESIHSITSVSCPNDIIDSSVSLNISFDLSLNSIDFDRNNFNLGKQFAKILINKKFYSEASICSFDTKTFLNMEFTDTIVKLINAINEFYPQIGGDSKNSFFKEPAGSFKIVSRGKYKKNILLIIDKNTTFDEKSIINYATANNIKINVLMFEKSAEQNLINITSQTGGLLLDKIDSTSNLNTLADIYKAFILGYKPCNIEWQLIYNCGSSHNIDISIPSLSLNDNFSFEIDNNIQSSLIASPKYINFSSIPVGATARQSFTITAKNRDILIDSLIIQKDFNLKELKRNDIDTTKYDTIDIVAKNMFRIIDGDIKNYLLEKDKFINITIEYTAYQEPINFTELRFVTNACNNDTVLITAGFPNKKPVIGTIKIVHPNLKETLIVGDTSFISWKGLLPKDVVQVEYSTDNGRNYQTIKNNTEGLSIDWKVPDTPSDSCRVKIYQLWPNNIGQTFYLRHKGQVNSAFFNSTGERIVTSCGDGNAYVWDVFTASLKFKLEGHTNKVTWANFDPNDKYIVTSSEDSSLRVWNYNDGSLLAILKEHKNKIESVSWDPTGHYLVSNDFSGEVIVWDTTWNPIKKIKSNYGPTKFASFNPINNSEIATANFGSNIKIWNWKDYKAGDKPIKTFETNAYNNWHVIYNSDGTKIASTTESSKPQRLYVWDVNKPEKPLYYISHNFDSLSNNSIITSSFFVHPELKKELILTSSTDNTARLWNADDGSIFPVIDYIGQNVFGNDKEKHHNAVRTAVFDKIGSRVVTASWDSTAIIWNLNQREIQQDVSDSVFRIVRVNGKTKDIDFGDLPLGYIKDSLVKSVFKNETQFTYKVYKIFIQGNSAQDFTINNQIKLPLILKPGDSINLELSFEPKDYGLRDAEIIFSIPAQQISAKLLGNSFQQTLYPNNPIVDFGEIRLGNFKDTTFSAIVRNISSKLVDIDSILIIGSYKDDFAITQGNSIRNINGNSDLLLTIRFNPLTIGRKNAQISIKYKDRGTPTIINLFGEGINYKLDSITIAVPNNISANLGDIITVPFYIQDLNEHSIPKSIQGFYTYLSFNSTILEPIGVFDEDIIDGYTRKLKITLPYDGKDSLLKTVDFKVAFGNDSITNLKLENSYPIGSGMLKINEQNGAVKINNLCNGSGVRLFDPYGKISLSQNVPNPVTDKTKINFEIIENSYTSLYVIDLLGNKVLDLIHKELSKGNYEIDISANQLQSGIYYYVLQTPTIYLIKSMQVIKD